MKRKIVSQTSCIVSLGITCVCFLCWVTANSLTSVSTWLSLKRKDIKVCTVHFLDCTFISLSFLNSWSSTRKEKEREDRKRQLSCSPWLVPFLWWPFLCLWVELKWQSSHHLCNGFCFSPFLCQPNENKKKSRKLRGVDREVEQENDAQESLHLVLYFWSLLCYFSLLFLGTFLCVFTNESV